MIAFALALAIFSTWLLLGWSLISVLGSRRNLVRNALLAPAVGAAALTLLLFELYRFGVPVRIGGPVATLVALAAAMLLMRAKTPLPVRALLPFAGLVFLAALLNGYPMLKYGFDWISYCNADMSFYVLSARGFLAHGYLAHINPPDIIQTRDASAIFWLSSMLQGWRCGSELVLAWVMSLTGIDGYPVYMPAILALHLVLISAATALVYRGRRYRTPALAACGWFALSSLLTFGLLYQLIAQIFGLSLLAAAAAFFLSPNPGAGRFLVRRILLGAIFVAGLGICYPEVSPFLALAFVLYHSLSIARARENWKALLRFAALAVCLGILPLITYLGTMLKILVSETARGSAQGSNSELFPYYLIPSGLAALWGFQPIAAQTPHPLIDIYIASGACLLVAGLAASLWLAWRREPVGAVATVMLVVAIRLFMTKSDFGLYKLAMYVQPFLLGTMTLAWFTICSRGAVRSRLPSWRMGAFVVPLALLAASGARTQQHYVRISADLSKVGSGFSEVPEASSDRILSRLKALSMKPRRDTVLVDSSNIVLGEFEAQFLPPSSQRFLTKDYFSVAIGVQWKELFPYWYADLTRPGYMDAARALVLERRTRFIKAKFDMLGSPSNEFGMERDPRTPWLPAAYTLVAAGPRQTIVNRSSEPAPPEERQVRFLPSEQVRNHLVLIESNLGQNYFGKAANRANGLVAMFQLEPDYFLPGKTMSGIGQTMLFEVLNPSESIRLVMDYTASLKSDASNTIPSPHAIGETRAPFPAAGRGSARLFSGPVVPRTIEGRRFVSIDMRVAGQKFADPRTGLMRWFGRDVPLDPRAITGFARDISAIGDDQYRALRPPAAIANFPDDLRDTSLEYSGIYEDGWVAESSFLRLLQTPRSSILRIRVMVPGLAPQPSNLRAAIGGRTLAQEALRPGDNDIAIPLAGLPPGVQRIELFFDRAAPLPSPDSRPVSALLRFVGFEETEPKEIADPPVKIGDHWHPFEKFGGNTFRWVENNAQFSIQSGASTAGFLAIELESGPGLGSRPFRLDVRAQSGKSWTLDAHGGRETLKVPMTLREGNNGFTLHVTGGGLPTHNDSRTLNFRVFTLSWLPQK